VLDLGSAEEGAPASGWRIPDWLMWAAVVLAILGGLIFGHTLFTMK
jgi:hypothetical protein